MAYTAIYLPLARPLSPWPSVGCDVVGQETQSPRRRVFSVCKKRVSKTGDECLVYTRNLGPCTTFCLDISTAGRYCSEAYMVWLCTLTFFFSLAVFPATGDCRSAALRTRRASAGIIGGGVGERRRSLCEYGMVLLPSSSSESSDGGSCQPVSSCKSSVRRRFSDRPSPSEVIRFLLRPGGRDGPSDFSCSDILGIFWRNQIGGTHSQTTPTLVHIQPAHIYQKSNNSLQNKLTFALVVFALLFSFRANGLSADDLTSYPAVAQEGGLFTPISSSSS